MKDAPIKSYSKSEIALLYGVSRKTFIVWIQPFKKELKELKYKPEQKILTVAQVELLFTKLGRP